MIIHRVNSYINGGIICEINSFYSVFDKSRDEFNLNDMNTIQKILILRFRRVGDAVISTVLCSSLKKSFPNAEIHYVLNENIAPLFQHHPDIDSIISFSNDDMKNLSTYCKKIRQVVQKNKYDIIIDTRSTIKTLWFSLFSLHTPYRIGKKKNYNIFLNNYRTDNKFNGTNDEVDKTLKLLSPLEKKFKIDYERNFRLYVTDNEKRDFKQYMEEKGIDFSKPVIVCAVTARLVHKVWNKQFMQEVLQRIIDKYDAQLVFNFGGKEEKSAAIELQQAMQNHRNIFCNIEAKNLRELAAMLSNCDFFFGNEGGPRHISQAFNIPSFAIYPPKTSKKEWLPNASDRFQGIESKEVSEKASSEELSFTEKFDLITPDVVWEKVDRMLNSYINRL